MISKKRFLVLLLAAVGKNVDAAASFIHSSSCNRASSLTKTLGRSSDDGMTKEWTSGITCFLDRIKTSKLQQVNYRDDDIGDEEPTFGSSKSLTDTYVRPSTEMAANLPPCTQRYSYHHSTSLVASNEYALLVAFSKEIVLNSILSFLASFCFPKLHFSPVVLMIAMTLVKRRSVVPTRTHSW